MKKHEFGRQSQYREEDDDYDNFSYNYDSYTPANYEDQEESYEEEYSDCFVCYYRFIQNVYIMVFCNLHKHLGWWLGCV